MTYTRSAIGLLTRQYRSVLKKCFLINMGLFALGAMINNANAASISTISEVKSTDFWNWTDGEKYYYIKFPGVTTNLVTITETEPADTEGKAKGYTTLSLPNNDKRKIWYQYDTDKETNTRIDDIADDGTNVQGKIFKSISSSSVGGAIYNTQDKSDVNIISDFISNSNSSNSDHTYGGAVYNYASGNTAKIGSITGDFLFNKSYMNAQYSYYSSYGGAIANYATSGNIASIDSITSNFVVNHADVSSQSASNTANGGAIYNYNATIGSITGDFIANYASVDRNTQCAYGGAIYNSGSITSIVGNFVQNSTYSDTYRSFGGAIYNTSSNFGSITGNFINNHSYGYYRAMGGAIFNSGIISSITGNFVGNYVQSDLYDGGGEYGGAIYNGAGYSGSPEYSSYSVITLEKTSFTGNYLEDKRKTTPNSIYNAGIINIANNATVTVNDGWRTYVHYSDATKVGQLVMLGDKSVLNMNIGNGTVQQDSLGKITNVGTINATFDIDLSNISSPKSDTITVSSVTQAGKINLTGLKFKGDYDTYKNTGFTRRLLINSDTTSNLQLKLALNKVTIDDTEYYVLEQGGKQAKSDTFDGNADWSSTYEKYNLSTDIYGEIVLASSDTANVGTTDDSITFTVRGTKENKSDIEEGDTLQVVNQSDLATRNFNATTDGESYKVRDDVDGLGKAGAGTININGKPDGASQNGSIDLNGKTGFELDKATTLNINNTDISNAKAGTDVINASSEDAVVNLTNSNITGSVANAGTINIDNSTISGNITGSGANQGTINVKSSWEMTGTVLNQNINVENGAILTAGAGNLVSSDNLNVKSGAEVDITNSNVMVGDANFKSGSKLSLKVNSLGDFGAFTANKITVADEGAKLSVTLAQGIQNGTVQLLKITSTAEEDQNFNNFEDITDNNMYIFEKADKNGLYNIKLAKTAEEISRETGGTETEAQAAGAWVDGGEFAEGTTAKEVADALAELAQDPENPQAFNDALSVVAPQDAPVVETAVTDVSDKLLLTLGNHLSGNDNGGLSSGDALQDVTIWAKGFYGKSKLSDSGNIRGFDAKNKGVIAGVDKKLDNSVKVGFGFQYNDSDIDAFRRDVEVDTITGFIYGEYRPSNWYVNGVASYGRSDYKEKKFTLGYKIDDKYNADTYSLQAVTGYDFKYVSPEIGARYYHIKRYGYEDSIGQKVSGSSMDLLRGVLGLRSSHEFGMFKPEIYVGMTYDIESDKDGALVSLPNGSSYAVDGKRLNRFGTEVNTSLTANLTDHASVTVGYEGKFRKDYKDNTGLIIAKYAF